MILEHHAQVIARCERRLDLLVWLALDQRILQKPRLEPCSECHEWHAATALGRRAHAGRCSG